MDELILSLILSYSDVAGIAYLINKSLKSNEMLREAIIRHVKSVPITIDEVKDYIDLVDPSTIMLHVNEFYDNNDIIYIFDKYHGFGNDSYEPGDISCDIVYDLDTLKSIINWTIVSIDKDLLSQDRKQRDILQKSGIVRSFSYYETTNHYNEEILFYSIDDIIHDIYFFIYQGGYPNNELSNEINDYSFDDQLSTFVYNKRLKGFITI